MFSFTSSPTQSASTKKSSKKDILSSVANTETSSAPDSLEPAIDGPPSSERIRAYTEQMKRSSIFGNNSRTETLSSSSASSSFVSRDLTSVSSDGLTLSRKSSSRSNASSMPSTRSERPESAQIFGSIFSRGGRKSRRNNSSSSLALGEGILEEGSAKDRYYGKGHSSRKGMSVGSVSLGPESQRRHLISGPYNFQHVTHTAQDQLPSLQRSNPTELVSEFSTLRASQAPTSGELKGIRAQDLHFNNFSSEALSAPSPEVEYSPVPPIEQRQRGVLRKSVQPPRAQRSMSYAKSHDNLGNPPPRPPRSPLSPTCPLELPVRTSSRASTRISSILFDAFDPLAKPNVERAHRNPSFRRPAPFAPPRPSPAPLLFSEQQMEYFPDDQASHALTTPGDEAWPLTASPSGNFGFELADVQEEEEVGSRRSRISIANSELRQSKSVPSLRLSYEAHGHSGNRVSAILGLAPLEGESSQGRPPLSPGFRFGDDDDDSWEKDIDYCYEHEIEADCDYQWGRCSGEEERAPEQSPSTGMESARVEPQLELPVEEDDRSIYQGRFRPSLLIPSTYDVPELSPMSNNSAVSPDPRTPQIHLNRPNHGRSTSHASSFKESHGFHLSPTLLIPADFQSQMEQDAAYDDHFSNNQSISATIFERVSYNTCISPVDESSSSIVSYRSSNLSHDSTRTSATNSRGSQDSMGLLSRAASINHAHRSIGSASSLPELIPSIIRKPVNIPKSEEVGANLATLNPAEDMVIQSDPTTSLQHQHNNLLMLDMKIRKGVNHFAPAALPVAAEVADEIGPLSSVAELFPAFPQEQVIGGQAHGRKISAPIVSQTVREFKTRPRAGTSASAANMVGGKKRGSYMLFPQI
ncbi:uncharacterized protein BP5553_00569 [Venustampulla echinocandica]|uniref:CRIB domain-containing protein n=1 Tax=Venustampulla echinocandica TaxID=2656787 RepID=A0A370TYJ6_9HELO|nr:uncharacterized protein BP5553_00569 [Venustampulla echinocandica]RDL40590.1 hypothetical protein BP5553_00569 [Venustampulla echinocandica]